MPAVKIQFREGVLKLGYVALTFDRGPDADIMEMSMDYGPEVLWNDAEIREADLIQVVSKTAGWGICEIHVSGKPAIKMEIQGLEFMPTTWQLRFTRKVNRAASEIAYVTNNKD